MNKMYLDEKIAKIASLLFALAIIGFGLYLLFTVKWLVYFLASFNIITLGLIFALLCRELIETWKKESE